MPNPISEARRLANRQNALRSTGPKTLEGKARSRENAVKHGLTGAGIALPIEDQEEVARRFVAIQEELVPATILGVYFAHQIALMTVRCQRAARQESAAITAKILRAPAEWDEVRAAEADHLMGWIGVEPAAYRRQLVATPEGIDRLIERLLGLKSELDRPVVVWDYNHYTQLEAFCGRREGDLPTSRGMKLSKAIQGDFAGIESTECDHLATEDLRRNWACDELTRYILAEVAKLEGPPVETGSRGAGARPRRVGRARPVRRGQGGDSGSQVRGGRQPRVAQVASRLLRGRGPRRSGRHRLQPRRSRHRRGRPGQDRRGRPDSRRTQTDTQQ